MDPVTYKVKKKKKKKKTLQSYNHNDLLVLVGMLWYGQNWVAFASQIIFCQNILSILAYMRHLKNIPVLGHVLMKSRTGKTLVYNYVNSPYGDRSGSTLVQVMACSLVQNQAISRANVN